MKKCRILLYLLVLVCLFFMLTAESCEETLRNQTEAKKNFGVKMGPDISEAGMDSIRIIEIDHCEYIWTSHAIIHKANCSNPEHHEK
jgi:hypothetical protein